MSKAAIMKILVMNCGSSSLKYRLIEMPSEQELVAGEAQRVGPKTAEAARIIHSEEGRKETVETVMPDHFAAFTAIQKLLARRPEFTADILAHRLVHGGTSFTDDAFIDANAIGLLEQTLPLAPIHNPPAVRLIEACHKLSPDLPQVAVFDTVYHSTISRAAREYALPQKWVKELHIHKYGFHGTSHSYVVELAAEQLGIPLDRFNAVSCHLGSGGASLCAVIGGRSVDNTFGYSPLQGLVMSTRSGDLDPAITLRLLAKASGDASVVDNMLNRHSGVLGLSGISGDLRDVIASSCQANDNSNRRDQHTVDVYLWRLRKYLGAYLTLVGNAHAVIFTDTIGEGVPLVRWAVCSGLEVFGVKIDPLHNQRASELPADLSAQDSSVRILAIRTNEELAIARRSYRLVERAAA
jgi:acetate kinase